MKISDITTSTMLNEADEDTLDLLLKTFRDTTGTFNNASHKFYSVRKAVSNKVDDAQKDILKGVTPSEFFKFLRDNKPKPTRVDTVQKSSEPNELKVPTEDDLKKAGTVYGLIYSWVETYYPKFSLDEITEMLYQSAVGDYEELPYIRKEVYNSYTRIEQNKEQKTVEELYPSMQKQFKLSNADIESMKGGKWYNEAYKEVQHASNNQPKTPGQAPLKPSKVVGYEKNRAVHRYDNIAFKAFKDNDLEKTKEYVAKRDIIHKAKLGDILNWGKD